MVHRKRWIIVLAVISLATISIFPWLPLSAHQDPKTSSGTQSTPSEISRTPTTKYSHANDLLIRGSVFNDRALSLQGVKLRIRRTGEKKNRWETYTNYRGEFAIRVPQGTDYEIAAEIKGFAKQSRSINAKNGIAEEKVIFRMEPVSGGHK